MKSVYALSRQCDIPTPYFGSAEKKLAQVCRSGCLVTELVSTGTRLCDRHGIRYSIVYSLSNTTRFWPYAK